MSRSPPRSGVDMTMLQSLADLVEILGLPFLLCAAMTAILGYLGLHVLRREIVFVDIAMAQIVAVGVIVAHLLFDAEGDSPLVYATAFCLAVVAAAFYSFTRRSVREISSEAVIGVSYAVAAAAALFMLGVASGGHVHAQNMLSGSVLWVNWNELLLLGIVFSCVGFCFYLLRKQFEKTAGGYEDAIREGMNVVGWDFLFYTLIGLVITFAVRIGGVVLVFCLLIIPATIAVMHSRNLWTRLLIAWTVGVSGSFLGLLFADRLDFSVGPAVAFLLGVGLVVATAWRRLSVAPAAGLTVVIVTIYTALLIAAPGSGVTDASLGSEEAGFAQSNAMQPADTASPGIESENPQARSEAVLQAIDQDVSSGAISALLYLAEDPPIFFRQQVVDRLNETLKVPFEYDVMLSFKDQENREAVEFLERKYGMVK